MSTQITTAFVEQYKSNVFHLAQQKGSRLRDAVRRTISFTNSHGKHYNLNDEICIQAY